ncbi:MAG: type I-G CRISPR-associated protein Cas8g1/Csx17, partial [Gemmatimonadaceae bacterium]
HLQSVLITLGRAERELAVTAGKVGQGRVAVRPLGGLSPEWIKRSNDGRAEYAVACALTAVHDPEGKIGPLRTNLEPVRIGQDQQKRTRATWSDGERHVVWSAADLPTNLVAVLDRRFVDGLREGCENLPLASPESIGLGAVGAFINAAVDDRQLDDLLWGLMLVDAGRGNRIRDGQKATDAPIPRAYALLKLLFLPRPLTIEYRDNGALRVRLTRPGEEGIHIRPEPAILHFLRAHRLGDACVLAMRRLRASGLNPLPRPIRGRRVRDDDWLELDAIDTAFIDPLRLAASLLIPISERALTTLGEMITNSEFPEGFVASEETHLSIAT